MKIPLWLTIAAITAAIALIYFLSKYNKAAQSDMKDYNYFAFNWGNTDVSNKVMDYWRKAPLRINAVKRIVYLDYALMAVYCSYLCFSLWHHSRIEYRGWLKVWLLVGIGAILLCTILDAVQDYKISQYVLSKERVADMRYFTYPKWSAFMLGAIPLVLSNLFKVF